MEQRLRRVVPHCGMLSAKAARKKSVRRSKPVVVEVVSFRRGGMPLVVRWVRGRLRLPAGVQSRALKQGVSVASRVDVSHQSDEPVSDKPVSDSSVRPPARS